MKKMSFDYFCKVVDLFQKQKAADGILKKERAKKSLTDLEKYNRFAQLGNVIGYKDIHFTFESGMGKLYKKDGSIVLGASIGDFVKEIQSNYDSNFTI